MSFRVRYGMQNRNLHRPYESHQHPNLKSILRRRHTVIDYLKHKIAHVNTIIVRITINEINNFTNSQF